MPTTKIKQEEDLESNLSDAPMDPDTTMVSAARHDQEQRAEALSEHGQRCASMLLNMMMSVSHIAPTSSSSRPPKPRAINNAMSLNLGTPGGAGGGTETVHVGRVLKNNGFGEIGGSASPSLSPTTSHASTRRSISVEEENGSPFVGSAAS